MLMIGSLVIFGLVILTLLAVLAKKEWDRRQKLAEMKRIAEEEEKRRIAIAAANAEMPSIDLNPSNPTEEMLEAIRAAINANPEQAAKLMQNWITDES